MGLLQWLGSGIEPSQIITASLQAMLRNGVAAFPLWIGPIFEHPHLRFEMFDLSQQALSPLQTVVSCLHG